MKNSKDILTKPSNNVAAEQLARLFIEQAKWKKANTLSKPAKQSKKNV